MRNHIKGYAKEQMVNEPAGDPTGETIVEPQAEKTEETRQPKFEMTKDKHGNQMLAHNGMNRHERRAQAILQKRHFKKLVANLTKRARRMEAKAKLSGPAAEAEPTATFEEVASALAVQAPETVPSED